VHVCLDEDPLGGHESGNTNCVIEAPAHRVLAQGLTGPTGDEVSKNGEGRGGRLQMAWHSDPQGGDGRATRAVEFFEAAPEGNARFDVVEDGVVVATRHLACAAVPGSGTSGIVSHGVGDVSSPVPNAAFTVNTSRPSTEAVARACVTRCPSTARSTTTSRSDPSGANER